MCGVAFFFGGITVKRDLITKHMTLIAEINSSYQKDN